MTPMLRQLFYRGIWIENKHNHEVNLVLNKKSCLDILGYIWKINNYRLAVLS